MPGRRVYLPMKLVPFILASLLAFTGAARADDGPADPYAAAPQQREHPRQLRRLLLEQFDRNGDGRLEPNERRHAVRALRRLERRLARQDRNGGGGPRGERRLQKLIQKYDLNHDGNVGPGEMPPAMARKLRRLDRDGNGWLDQNDLGPRSAPAPQAE